MDRLPKHKDLVFERVRKELYLRLTKVIRVLASGCQDASEGEQIHRYVESLGDTIAASYLAPADSVTNHRSFFCCVLADVNYATMLFKGFILAHSGNGNRTRRVRAGIERLEWLVENRDGLEITGDVKDGYQLVLKPE